MLDRDTKTVVEVINREEGENVAVSQTDIHYATTEAQIDHCRRSSIIEILDEDHEDGHKQTLEISYDALMECNQFIEEEIKPYFSTLSFKPHNQDALSHSSPRKQSLTEICSEQIQDSCSQKKELDSFVQCINSTNNVLNVDGTECNSSSLVQDSNFLCASPATTYAVSSKSLPNEKFEMKSEYLFVPKSPIPSRRLSKEIRVVQEDFLKQLKPNSEDSSNNQIPETEQYTSAFKNLQHHDISSQFNDLIGKSDVKNLISAWEGHKISVEQGELVNKDRLKSEGDEEKSNDGNISNLRCYEKSEASESDPKSLDRKLSFAIKVDQICIKIKTEDLAHFTKNFQESPFTNLKNESSKSVPSSLLNGNKEEGKQKITFGLFSVKNKSLGFGKLFDGEQFSSSERTNFFLNQKVILPTVFVVVGFSTWATFWHLNKV